MHNKINARTTKWLLGVTVFFSPRSCRRVYNLFFSDKPGIKKIPRAKSPNADSALASSRTSEIKSWETPAIEFC